MYQTPFEAWSATKLEVTHFRVFSYRAWARIPFEKRKALDPQSIECIFVGYPDGNKGLRDIYAQDHQAARNGLVGDNSDLWRTRSEFIEPPLVLTTTKPMPSWHCHLVQSSDPQSYAEDSGYPSWESTIEEEYNSLLENQTWDLVPLPLGRKIVRCKWVYRTKSAADMQITRQKARLVAKGFQQVHGIDYNETLAPVAKMNSIRLALAIVVAQGWEVHQIHVKNAFLHGDLSKEIDMEQPHGFI
eukprot:PITA_27706